MVRRRGMRLALALLVVGGMALVPTPGQAQEVPTPGPDAPQDPVPTEANPEVLAYGDDSIVWWGDDCDSVVVEVWMDVDVGEEVDTVAWDSGPNCEPIVTDPPKVDNTTSPAPTLARAASCPPVKFNWIHTSHTLQDPVFIDLAWLRTSFKRGWRCDTTYWTEVYGDMIAFDGSGPSWWSHDPPTWAVINWSCLPIINLCTKAKSEARAWFHVNFASCPGGHQDIRIDNEVWTKADGSHTFHTAKNASCTGIHSATGSTVNGSKSGGYGGAETTVTATPNVSGT